MSTLHRALMVGLLVLGAGGIGLGAAGAAPVEPSPGQTCTPGEAGTGRYCSGGIWHAGSPLPGHVCVDYSGMPQQSAWGALTCRNGTWQQ